MFTWTYIEFACVSKLRNMTQVFRHEVPVFVDTRSHPDHYLWMFFTSKFMVSSAPKRGVWVCLYASECVRGVFIPQTSVKRITNTGITLAKLFPGFIFNSTVETKSPVSTASENQATGARPSLAASHTPRVCVWVCVPRKRARAEEWKEAWRGVIAVVRASGAVGHRDDVIRGGSGLICVIYEGGRACQTQTEDYATLHKCTFTFFATISRGLSQYVQV